MIDCLRDANITTYACGKKDKPTRSCFVSVLQFIETHADTKTGELLVCAACIPGEET